MGTTALVFGKGTFPFASIWKILSFLFPSCSRFERRTRGQTVGCDNSSLESPRVCRSCPPCLHLAAQKHFLEKTQHSLFIPDCVHAGEGSIVQNQLVKNWQNLEKYHQIMANTQQRHKLLMCFSHVCSAPRQPLLSIYISSGEKICQS